MENNHKHKLDGVFEGGGVKGTGLVGAVEVTEQKGYIFENVAGTSAGAIVAAFIAAGYTAHEMRDILYELEYPRFKDRGAEDYVPLVGSVISLIFKKGIYEGNYFEQWLRDLLKQKNVVTFGDLALRIYPKQSKFRYKLQVVASDISRGKLLVLPRDIGDYGIDPDELDVARAVRMSMSLPYFYKPVQLQDAKGEDYYIVDGGILSNYPVWIFDDESNRPAWPTFGYKLVEPDEGKPKNIKGPISMLTALFSTMMEAHDARYIKNSDFRRTIPIETLGIQTTDFDMTLDRKKMLYESGRKAAEEFFATWNFKAYKTQLQEKQLGRRKQVWNQ